MNNNCRICTIGGGTGMPVINESLIKAGFKEIKSIVTTFDNGGDTGRLRTDERGQTLANSDYWRSLISLWDDGEQKRIWEDMLRYRDGKSRNFGNTFFQFMSEKTGSLAEVDTLFKKLTLANIRGEVIPVSLSPSNVVFKTISGKKYTGERFLDELRMSKDEVVDIWLEPKASANLEAINAIKGADLIIVCPGSLYGSLITNFLVDGIRESFQKSRAKKILMVNLMSLANEGEIRNQDDYVKLFKSKIGLDFDFMLMADVSKLDSKKLNKSLGFYRLESSVNIEYKSDSKNKTVLADIATIDEVNWRIRHSQAKLARYFKSLKW